MENFKRAVLKYRVAVGVLGLLLLGAIGLASAHLYDYTEHDPTFCVSCHVMNDAFSSWETSIHKNVECHDCHYATILERNQMLLTTLFKNPEQVTERPHEKIIVPSSMCIKCHWEGEAAKISDSTGHALHWFKGSIECTSCHAIRLHKFEPEQKLCLNCHQKGNVVLPGMKDMPCADCHSFSKGRLIPKKADCQACHADRVESTISASGSLAHTRLECKTCHRTHEPDKPAGGLCQDCHRLAMKRGKHPIHIAATSGDCTTCHQPHSWTISQNESKKLCSKCHVSYPLIN